MSEIIEGKPQLPPGFCFLCEQSNPVRYVDTLRDFEGIVRERLDGRKYVCEACIEEYAGKLGFITPKEADKLRAKLAEVSDSEKQLAIELGNLKSLKNLVDQLSEKSAPKPASRAKAAA